MATTATVSRSSVIEADDSAAHRRHVRTGRLLVLPATVWMALFFALPLAVVVIYAFLTPDSITQVKLPVTVDNFIRVARPTYTSVLWRSITTAFFTTVICAVIGYPLAFFIATRPKTQRNLFLLLIVIPFWTNFLVRTYAWLFILSANGPINGLVVDYLKLTTEPLQLVYTPLAVMVGLVYGELPFMVLPIYTAIEKFNFRMVEAAHDLGANDWWAFWRIVLPITAPGLIAGCILVFIPSIGAFVTPDLLGGAKALMIGTQINDVLRTTTGKPLGAALSLVLMLIVAIALLVYFRRADRDEMALG